MSSTIRCIVRPTGKVLAFPSMTLDNRTIENYFADGSNNDIDLKIETKTHEPFEFHAVDDAELQAILNKTTNNKSNVTSVDRIGLLIAGSYSPRPNDPIFGYMFDTGFAGTSSGTVAREGCVIFADTIRARRPSAQAFADEMLFTAIHELGHVFNLWHIDSPQNMMARSPLDQTFAPPFVWTDLHTKFLRQCSTQNVVHPGGSQFGHRGTLGPFDNDAQNRPKPADFGLELLVDVPQREFHSFEPVELELMLRVASGVDRAFEVPDALDPAYSSFEIWIEQPNEERRRYRSIKHFCMIPGKLTVAPEKPFRRDIAIFGSARGYTFRHIGVHKVWAHFLLADGSALVSNTIEVNVLPDPQDDRGCQLANILTERRMAELLFYRSQPLPPSRIEWLQTLRDDFADSPATAASLYAQGRATLRMTERAKSGKSERRSTRDALRWLDEAAQHPRLTPHRREKAFGLIRERSA